MIDSLLSYFLLFAELLIAAQAIRLIGTGDTLSVRTQDTLISHRQLIPIQSSDTIRRTTFSVQNVKEMQTEQMASNN